VFVCLITIALISLVRNAKRLFASGMQREIILFSFILFLYGLGFVVTIFLPGIYEFINYESKDIVICLTLIVAKLGDHLPTLIMYIYHRRNFK